MKISYKNKNYEKNEDQHPSPVCHANATSTFFENRHIPVHCNILWADKNEAKDVARADIVLVHCEHCGNIYNPAFKNDLMRYDSNYENSLYFSPYRYQSKKAREIYFRNLPENTQA
jgi:hypothetical protein